MNVIFKRIKYKISKITIIFHIFLTLFYLYYFSKYVGLFIGFYSIIFFILNNIIIFKNNKYLYFSYIIYPCIILFHRLINEINEKEKKQRYISMLNTTERADRTGRNNFIDRILTWKRKNRSIVFRHTLREGNTYADWLANWSLSKDLGLHHLEVPPEELRFLLLRDVDRFLYPVFLEFCSLFFLLGFSPFENQKEKKKKQRYN